MIPEVVDTYATGNSETVPPIDIGYSGHTYSRVVPTSAPSNWLASSQLTFQPSTFANAVYDLSESYINVEFAPYVISSADGVKRYLGSLSTVGIDCTFGTSLVSSCDITIGDKTVKSVEATQQTFPYVAGVMAVLENKYVDTEGSAKPAIMSEVSSPTPEVAIPALGVGSIPSVTYVSKDAKTPFDVCLDNSKVDFEYNARVGWPRAVSVLQTIGGNAYAIPPVVDPISPSAYYRSELIRRRNESYRIGDNGVPCTTQATIKLPSSLRSLKSKIPGSVGLNISMTRAPDYYALHGDALYEYIVASGVVPANAGATISLGLDISRFDLYLKVIYPTEALLASMRLEAQSQLFHYNSYHSRVRVLTSSALAESVPFSKRPKAVLVGIVNKDFISPSDGSLYNTPNAQGRSQFNMTPTLRSGGRWCTEVSNLCVSIDGKRYPDNDGYTTVAGGTAAYGTNDRAYREFTKCLLNPDSVKFFQWLNFLRLFAFDLTEAGVNIHDFTVKSSGVCNVEVTGQVVLPGTLDPSNPITYGLGQYMLVIIGIADGFFSIRDFQAVEVSV